MANPNKFTKTLAIKPAYQHMLGTEIAIFDDETKALESCGLIFAADHIELATKARRFWENHVGTRCEPKTLRIDYPQNNSPFSQRFAQWRSFMAMALVCAYVEVSFSPKTTIRTTM